MIFIGKPQESRLSYDYNVNECRAYRLLRFKISDENQANYSRTSTNGHLSLTVRVFCPGHQQVHSTFIRF